MKTKNIVLSALLAALTCICTMVIRIPSPLNGYIHIGDGVVLLCGWILSPVYGLLAAGIGAALADLLSGYALYAPVTFVIKASMVLCICYLTRALEKHTRPLVAKLIGSVVAECVMVVGYLLFESILYGFVPSLVNVPPNAVQGVGGLIVGILLVQIIEKQKLFRSI